MGGRGPFSHRLSGPFHPSARWESLRVHIRQNLNRRLALFLPPEPGTPTHSMRELHFMPLSQNAKATFSTRCCPAVNVTFMGGKKTKKKFVVADMGKEPSRSHSRRGVKENSIPSCLGSVQSTQILILQLWWLFTKSKTGFMGSPSTTACFFFCFSTEWT